MSEQEVVQPAEKGSCAAQVAESLQGEDFSKLSDVKEEVNVDFERMLNFSLACSNAAIANCVIQLNRKLEGN